MNSILLPLGGFCLFLAGCATGGLKKESVPAWNGPDPFKKVLEYNFAAPESQGTGRQLLLLTGRTMGEIDACGCSLNPKGGLDRRLNFVRSIRTRKKHPIYAFDAGNTLFASEEISSKQKSKALARADLILKAYSEMQIEALNVGTLDLALGVDTLKDLAKKHSIRLISSNLEDVQGKLVFESEFQVKLKDFELFIIGLTAGSEKTLQKGFKVRPYGEVVNEKIKALNSKSLLVILSDLGQSADEELAQKLKTKAVIVGSREPYSLEIPLHMGSSVVVRPHSQGQQWSLFEFDWKPEAQGWYNFLVAPNFMDLWGKRRESYLKLSELKELTADQKAELATIEESRQQMAPYIPGDVAKKIFYHNVHFNLDEEFARPNAYTPLIQKLK